MTHENPCEEYQFAADNALSDVNFFNNNSFNNFLPIPKTTESGQIEKSPD